MRVEAVDAATVGRERWRDDDDFAWSRPTASWRTRADRRPDVRLRRLPSSSRPSRGAGGPRPLVRTVVRRRGEPLLRLRNSGRVRGDCAVVRGRWGRPRRDQAHLHPRGAARPAGRVRRSGHSPGRRLRASRVSATTDVVRFWCRWTCPAWRAARSETSAAGRSAVPSSVSITSASRCPTGSERKAAASTR